MNHARLIMMAAASMIGIAAVLRPGFRRVRDRRNADTYRLCPLPAAPAPEIAGPQDVQAAHDWQAAPPSSAPTWQQRSSRTGASCSFPASGGSGSG